MKPKKKPGILINFIQYKTLNKNTTELQTRTSKNPEKLKYVELKNVCVLIKRKLKLNFFLCMKLVNWLILGW